MQLTCLYQEEHGAKVEGHQVRRYLRYETSVEKINQTFEVAILM